MKMACLAAGLMTTFTEHTLLVLSSVLCPERTDGEGTMGRKGRADTIWGSRKDTKPGVWDPDFRMGCVTHLLSLTLSGPECLYSKMKWLDLIRKS